MAQATEKQAAYLRDLIETTRELVAGRADYPGPYQLRKYGEAPRDDKEMLKAWRQTVRGNKASDRREFANVLNEYLDGFNPISLTKAAASRAIDTLKNSWVSGALDAHFGQE